MLKKILSLFLVCEMMLAADPGNIVQYLNTDGRFNTLLSLVQGAGLMNAFGAVPLTLFAPTDSAFLMLDPEILRELSRNTTVLANFLKFHVISDSLLSLSLLDGISLNSQSGEQLRVHRYQNGAVTVENAKITNFDRIVANGVIHTVNRVLIPPNTTLESAITKDDIAFADLFASLLIMEFRGVLHNGNYTVFAPTSIAFDNIKTELSNIVGDHKKMEQIIKYHVVPGTFYSAGLSDGMRLQTLEGSYLHISLRAGGVLVSGARVTRADDNMVNGVLHIIDSVLIPPLLKLQ